jgi:hypothetical protein
MIDGRDYIGYGVTPPHAQWPNDARIALNINLNLEGGGEHSLMDGDSASKGMLNDIGMPPYPGLRSPIVESVFEYGSRVGGWRLLALFRRFGVKVAAGDSPGSTAQSAVHARLCRRGARGRQPPLSLAGLPRHAGGGARAYPARIRDH